MLPAIFGFGRIPGIIFDMKRTVGQELNFILGNEIIKQTPQYIILSDVAADTRQYNSADRR